MVHTSSDASCFLSQQEASLLKQFHKRLPCHWGSDGSKLPTSQALHSQGAEYNKFVAYKDIPSDDEIITRFWWRFGR